VKTWGRGGGRGGWRGGGEVKHSCVFYITLSPSCKNDNIKLLSAGTWKTQVTETSFVFCSLLAVTYFSQIK